MSQLVNYRIIEAGLRALADKAHESAVAQEEGKPIPCGLSEGDLESVDYNKAVVESCDEILAKLNPQIAKDKQQEQDISNLKSDMNGVKGTLSEIKSLLSDALKLSKN